MESEYVTFRSHFPDNGSYQLVESRREGSGLKQERSMHVRQTKDAVSSPQLQSWVKLYASRRKLHPTCIFTSKTLVSGWIAKKEQPWSSLEGRKREEVFGRI